MGPRNLEFDSKENGVLIFSYHLPPTNCVMFSPNRTSPRPTAVLATEVSCPCHDVYPVDH